MEKIKGVIFNENGLPINSDNIDVFTMEMSDKLLVKTYKSTIYQHYLIIEMEGLIEKGLVKRAEGSVYDPTLTETAITSMRLEIVDRFDLKFHDKVYKSIDLSFLKNKPKNL